MSPGLLLTVAGATGAAVMIIELMAVRLMAPWFGQSQIVWTNVIGVVLAALAVGQWLGGRWAERQRGQLPAWLLVVAGSLAMAMPDIVGWLAPAALPDGLMLEEAYPFITLGSLLVSIVAMGIPMAAMGAVAPWLVRLSRDASETPGRAAGRILGAGTLGSLIGTFGATHLLLGALGSSLTVRCAGALLLALGVLLLFRSAGASRRVVLVVLVPAILWPIAEPELGESSLETVETPYQFARVVEQDGTRLLRLNEGLESFHSAYTPGEVWTGLYFDAFAAPALTAPLSSDGVRRVLVLGLGAGTMARQALALDSTLSVTGVEIDAALLELGRRWFDLPQACELRSGGDARLALREAGPDFGAVLVDAYAQQIYLPQHMCTREFFTELRERLVPGGVAALNLAGRTREDPVVAAVSATFASVFDAASMARVPGTRNMILLGWNGDRPQSQVMRARLEEVGVVEQIGWVAEGVGFAPVAPEDGRQLTDGDAPVEALAHQGWRRPS